MSNKLKYLLMTLVSIVTLFAFTQPQQVSADTQMLDVVKAIAGKKEGETIKTVGEGWDLFAPDEETKGAPLTKSTEGIFTSSYKALDNTIWNGSGENQSLEYSANFAKTLNNIGLDHSFAGGDGAMALVRALFAFILIFVVWFLAIMSTMTQWIMNILSAISPISWMKTALDLVMQGNIDADGNITGAEGTFGPIIEYIASVIYWVSNIATVWWLVILIGSIFAAITNIGSIKPSIIQHQSTAARVAGAFWNFIKRMMGMVVVPFLLLTAAGELSQDLAISSATNSYVQSTVTDIYGNWFYFKGWAEKSNMAIPTTVDGIRYDQDMIDEDDVRELNSNTQAAGLTRVNNAQNGQHNGIQMATWASHFLWDMWAFGDKYGGNAYESYVKRVIRRNFTSDEARKDPIGWLSKDATEPYKEDTYGKFKDEARDDAGISYGANLRYNPETKVYSSNGNASLNVYGMFNYLNVRADDNQIYYSNNALFQGDANVSYHANVTYVPGTSVYGMGNYLFIILKAFVIALVTLGLSIQLIVAVSKANVDILAAVYLFPTGIDRGLASLFSGIISYLMKVFVISAMFSVVPDMIKVVIDTVDEQLSNALGTGIALFNNNSTFMPPGINENGMGVIRIVEAIILGIILFALLKVGGTILKVIGTLIENLMNNINRSQGMPSLANNAKDDLNNALADASNGNDGKDGTGKDGANGEGNHDEEGGKVGNWKDHMKNALLGDGSVGGEMMKGMDQLANMGRNAKDRATDAYNSLTNPDADRQLRTKEQQERDLADQHAARLNTQYNMDPQNKGKQKTADFDSLSEESKAIEEAREEQHYEATAESISDLSNDIEAMEKQLDNQFAHNMQGEQAEADNLEDISKEQKIQVDKAIEEVVTDVGNADIDMSKVQTMQEDIDKVISVNSQIQNDESIAALANAGTTLDGNIQEIQNAQVAEQQTNSAIQGQIQATTNRIAQLQQAGAPQQEIAAAQSQLSELQSQHQASNSRIQSLATMGQMAQKMKDSGVGKNLESIAQTTQTLNTRADKAATGYKNEQTAAALTSAVQYANTAHATSLAAKQTANRHASFTQAMTQQLGNLKDANATATRLTNASMAINSGENTQEMQQDFARSAQQTTATTASIQSHRAKLASTAKSVAQVATGRAFNGTVQDVNNRISQQNFGGLGTKLTHAQKAQDNAAKAKQKISEAQDAHIAKKKLLHSENISSRNRAIDHVQQEIGQFAFDAHPASGAYVSNAADGSRLTNGQLRKGLEYYQQVLSKNYSSPTERKSAVIAAQKNLVQKGVSQNLLTSTQSVNAALNNINKKRTNLTDQIKAARIKDNKIDWSAALSQQAMRSETDYEADLKLSGKEKPKQ